MASFTDAGDLVSYTAKANFRALGKRFGKQTPLVAKAIADADAAALAASIATTGKAEVEVPAVDPEKPTPVSADEVIISEHPREGWSVVNEQGETVALDLELTPDLVQAGLAREAIRHIQETRKNTGLDVSDRITLWWSASGDTAEAVEANLDLIGDEVLATTIERVEAPDGEGWATEPGLGLAVKVAAIG